MRGCWRSMAFREMSHSMSETMDTEFLAWVEAQKTATKAWFADGAPQEAVQTISRFLDRELSVDIRREAFAFRAMILQDVGSLTEAKGDFLTAWKLASEANYIRFELESSLAEVCVAAGEREQADRWYLAALRTAENDLRAVSAGVILRFLRFRGDTGLDGTERTLLRRLLRMSWKFLSLPGTPDLEALEDVAKEILRAESSSGGV